MQSTTTETLRIKLFGSLRDFGDARSAEIYLPKINSLPELREALCAHFKTLPSGAKAIEILKDSAFADETKVLDSDANLTGRSWIAILPPVCGG